MADIVDITHLYKTEKQQTFASLPRHLQQWLGRYEQVWKIGLYSSIAANLIDEVFPGVWVGGDDAPQDREFLEKNLIGQVLNMAKNIEYEPAHENTLYTKLGIHDGELPPVGVYQKAAHIIWEARNHGHNVVVHCAAGISRSVTAVVAYKMLYDGMTFSDALVKIQRIRPIASPHPLLVRSLIRDFGDAFKP